MSIIAWFILGLGTGWFGNILMSSGFGGLVSDLVLGVFGAIVGGFFMIFVMDSDYTIGINFPALLFAIGGALGFLAMYRVCTGQRILRNR